METITIKEERLTCILLENSLEKVYTFNKESLEKV